MPTFIRSLLIGCRVGKTLEAEQPQFAACRSLLRAGPAASLRMNIRAVNADLFELVLQMSICVGIWF